MLASIARRSTLPISKPSKGVHINRSSTSSSVSKAKKSPSTLKASFVRSIVGKTNFEAKSKLYVPVRYYGAHPPAGDDVPLAEMAKVAADGKRIYSRHEVATHNTKTDAWIIIDEKVYNITSWIEFHPGGEIPLTKRLGSDATVDFRAIGHSHRAFEVLESLHIGHVKDKKRYTME